MYITLFNLIMISLLISFALVFNFKKIVLSPESYLKDVLYKSYSKVTIDSNTYNLDYEVDIDDENIRIYVLGIYDSLYFDEIYNSIYRIARKKRFKKSLNIYISTHNNKILSGKNFK